MVARRVFARFTFALLLGTLAFGYAAYALGTRLTAATTPQPLMSSQQPAQEAVPINPYHRSALPPNLRSNLAVLGDRLETSGRERLVMVGTLTSSNSSNAPVQITTEQADRVRVELSGSGSAAEIVTLDAQAANSSATQTTTNADSSEQALTETILFDTADRFFMKLSTGAASRLIGEKLPLDETAIASSVSTRYDVYELIDHIPGIEGERRKLFYFNAETLLLERVRYRAEVAGVTKTIEVKIEDWSKEGDQNVPRRIIRSEDGQETVNLEVSTVSFSPAASDGIFANTQSAQ